MGEVVGQVRWGDVYVNATAIVLGCIEDTSVAVTDGWYVAELCEAYRYLSVSVTPDDWGVLDLAVDSVRVALSRVGVPTDEVRYRNPLGTDRYRPGQGELGGDGWTAVVFSGGTGIAKLLFTAVLGTDATHPREFPIPSADISSWVFANVGQLSVDPEFRKKFGINESMTTWDWGRIVGHLGACDQLGGLIHPVETGTVGAGLRRGEFGPGGDDRAAAGDLAGRDTRLVRPSRPAGRGGTGSPKTPAGTGCPPILAANREDLPCSTTRPPSTSW
jgi:hypothetical protein